jgi:serine/threonine-protein kinase RsbW
MSKYRESMLPVFSGGLAWQRVFPGRPDVIRAAREFTGYLLRGSVVEDEAVFVVDELAINAVRHTLSGQGGTFTVEISLNGLCKVAVHDQGGAGYPTVKHDPIDNAVREDGRGLLAVSRMAAALGICGSPAAGHTVWAELQTPLHDRARLDQNPAPRLTGAEVPA